MQHGSHLQPAGVSGEWIGAWLILCNRTLSYITDSTPMQRVDLRKVRGIMLHSVVDSDNSPKTTDKGPNLLLDCPSGTIYMRMWTSRETKVRILYMHFHLLYNRK